MKLEELLEFVSLNVCSGSRGLPEVRLSFQGIGEYPIVEGLNMGLVRFEVECVVLSVVVHTCSLGLGRKRVSGKTKVFLK